MRRILAFVVVSCLAAATGLTTASAAAVRSNAAAGCGVGASAQRSLTRLAGASTAQAALRACAAQGGIRAIKANHAASARSSGRARTVGATIVVDDDGFATAADCDNAVTEALTSIIAGVAAAVTGDTVLVCPGTYAGGIEVPSGVSVQGTGATKPVVGCAPDIFGTTGMTLSGDEGPTTIEGLDFEGGGTCNTGIGLYQAFGFQIMDVTINGFGIGIFGEIEAANIIGPDNSITALQTGILSFLSDDDAIVDNYVGIAPNADIAQIVTAVFSGDGNVIEGNSLTGGLASQYGIYMDSGDFTDAELNEVSGHQYGVWVQDSVGVKVKNNLIHGNDYGLANVATDSCQEGRAPCDRVVFPGPTPALVDGTRNWWGSASGPGDWGIGTGDKVSAEVDFFPWALNAALTSFRACDKRLTIPGNLRGTKKSDVLCGSGGNDTINGRKGADLIIANNGNDVVSGKEGADSVIAGGGNDFINGNTEFDSIQGRAGTDICWFNENGGQTSSCETSGVGPPA